MKTTRIVLLALLFLGAFAAAGSAATTITAGVHLSSAGHASVDLGFFYDDLASYGSWVERPSYGWVWRPRAVASSWRPYERGHWALTDDGWTWISEEPYGWATYHYGRWYFDPDYGWEWVPGSEWAPAWVSWQEGGDYIGWAPLPPSVAFSGGGFSGVDFSAVLTPDAYVFVPERQFLAPRITTYVVPRAQVVTVFRQTRNITNYRVVNDRVINQGLPVERVQQVTGRPVPHYQIADLGASQRHQVGQVQANRVAFFRPQVEKSAKVVPPSERPAARQSVVRPDVAKTAQARQAQAPQPAAVPHGKPQRVERQPPQHAEAAAEHPPHAKAAPPDASGRHNRPASPPPAQAAAARQPRPAPPPTAAHPQPQASADSHPHGQGKPAGKPPGKPKEKPQDQGKPPGGPGR